MTKRRLQIGGVASLLTALALASCKEDGPKPTGEATGPTTSAKPLAEPSTPAPKTARIPGDAEKGHALIKQFECNRCHDGTGYEPAAFAKHCITCHQDIMSGKFGQKAPKEERDKWKSNVWDYQDAPSLEKLGSRLRAEWIEQYLLDPYDVRPHIEYSMPRLQMTKEQARDMAEYLAKQNGANAISFQGGDPKNGRDLLEKKNCGSCHLFSGVPELPTKPTLKGVDEPQRKGTALAPDLRFTRDRWVLDHLVSWLVDPASMLPGTTMPSHNLRQSEAKDLAAYIVETKLEAPKPKPTPKRLAVLDRKVTFEEVNEKVFKVTCRHCHADPDALMGDGGPGNTGGFGFKPRKLDFSTYRGVLAGYVDDQGERQSVFAKTKDGTPRLVASLLARQLEVSGKKHDEVRGMPLGLPAPTPEQVQLVESWIEQGRPK